MLMLSLRSCVPFVLVLLLLISIPHGAPAQNNSRTPAPPTSSSDGTDTGPANPENVKNKTGTARPPADVPDTGVPEATPKASPNRSGSILTIVGVVLAALACLAASAFALLGWQEAKRGRERIASADRNSMDALSRLSSQIPLTSGGDKAALKQLSTDVQHLSQDIAALIKNSGSKSQAGPNAGFTNTPDVGSPQDLALSQLKSLVQIVSSSVSDSRNDISQLSSSIAAQTNQIGQIGQANSAISGAVLSIKRQLDTQPDPQNLPLTTFLNQVVDSNDTLAETGQRLQATYQKLSSGSRDGDYFLDNLAQTVFMPLAVPLASANLSNAQMSHRISFLGAIERTRVQAAAAARAAGLEMMIIEVSKTPFDGNRHDAILGTEIRTDRAELSGKVAEVLRHGFLQKNKDNSMRVLRKAQVRLFLQAQPKAPTPPPAVVSPPAVVPVPSVPKPVLESSKPQMQGVSQSQDVPPVPVSELTEVQLPQSPPEEPALETQLEEAAHATAAETGNEAQGARQQIEAWQGTRGAEVGNSDWKTVAEALTLLHQTEGLDAPALDALLAGVFPEDSPRSILPQLGEVTKPLYEAETPLPEGCVAEVLRIGIDLSREGGLNRPVVPRVRLAPKLS